MSRRKPDIVLSGSAEQDIADILQYTEETWGELQMERYAAKLEDGFRLLQDSPHIGKSYETLFPGCRCQHVEHHLVLYNVTETTIRIARVLHEKMDLERHIEPEQSRDQDRER